MNKNQRAFLRIFGVLILFVGILISAYFFGNPDLKEDILRTNYLCNLEIRGVEVGEVGQTLLNMQGDCLKANRGSFLIRNNWIFYVIGIVLFLLGLFKELGDKK